jgi:2-succinyl-5-enolpyruvyl-6-hydroxy-3-cyclohexene-1-carboxylate synthase
MPDLILRFGGGITLKSLQAFVDNAKVPTVAIADDERWFDPQLSATHRLTGNATQIARALAQGETSSKAYWQTWLSYQQRVERALQHADRHWDEPIIARTVVASLREGASLLLASSMPIRDVDAFAQNIERRIRVFANRGANGIDGLVSTALGIAKAAPQLPTVALLGDLSTLHDLSGFVAVRGADVDMTLVVVNNDGGGIFSFLPIAHRSPHFERLFGTPHGVDFAHVASLAGAAYTSVSSAAALQAALNDGVGRGIHLIEAKTRRSTNVEDHQRRLRVVAQELGVTP